MELPTPPTDSLYKFLAIFGLVLIAGCATALYTIPTETKVQITQLERANADLKLKQLDLEEEQRRLERSIQSIEREIASAEADAEPATPGYKPEWAEMPIDEMVDYIVALPRKEAVGIVRIMEANLARNKRERVRIIKLRDLTRNAADLSWKAVRKGQEKIGNLDSQIQNNHLMLDLDSRRTTLEISAFLGLLIGTGMTIIGFVLWGWRIQRYDDLRLYLESQELRTKVERIIQDERTRLESRAPEQALLPSPDDGATDDRTIDS